MALNKELDDYSKLSDAEKKCLCNGCGGGGSIFRPPHWFQITPFCDTHDYLYHIGGDDTDRLIADKYLRNGILSLGAQISWYNPKRWYYVIWSHAFYYGVRFGGKKYWGT